MNAQAVALAADSAVSIEGGAKTFISAEKIFRLSAWEPVALMIHGNAAFMGVPWEALAKSYRHRIGSTSFPTLAEYADDFAKHVRATASELFDEEVLIRQARVEIRSRLVDCFELFEMQMKVALQDKGFVPAEGIPVFLHFAVGLERQKWSKAPLLPGLVNETHAHRLIKRFAGDARAVQKDIFAKFPILQPTQEKLDDLCGLYLTRMFRNQDVGHTTGVVFAGFGAAEVFPRVIEYAYDGMVGDTLRCCLRSEYEVSLARPAAVVAFAQKDMVKAFMDGIDPHFKDQITDSLRTFLTEYSDVVLDSVPGLDGRQREHLKAEFRRIGGNAFIKYRDSMKEWRRREYAEKTLGVIRVLPKDELASVAESLVSLTSLKRRVSMDASVSPPIDVCVISKHDGIVWVKKKHYFPIDLNSHFADRDRHFFGSKEDHK